MFYGKNMECPKKFKVPKFKKKKFFSSIVEKKWCHYPPYCQPIWTKFLFEVLHIMDYLHVKFHPNRSTLSAQNSVRKSKIGKKWLKKSSLSWWHCHIRAGMYEPWAKIPLRDCWWCPKKISWPWEHFLGVK